MSYSASTLGLSAEPFEVSIPWVKVTLEIPAEHAALIAEIAEWQSDRFMIKVWWTLRPALLKLRAGPKPGWPFLPDDPLLNWLGKASPLFEDLGSDPAASIELRMNHHHWEEFDFVADCLDVSVVGLLRAVIHESCHQIRDEMKAARRRERRAAAKTV